MPHDWVSGRWTQGRVCGSSPIPAALKSANIASASSTRRQQLNQLVAGSRGMQEKFQNDAAANHDQPAVVDVVFSETKAAVKALGFFKIAGRKIGCGVIGHDGPRRISGLSKDKP